MKIYSKIALPALVGMMIVYTSCNKSTLKPAPQTQAVGADVISSQVALGFTNTVSGGYGGVNLNAGVDSITLANYQGPQHTSSQDLLCGFFNDTKVNYNTNSGDTLRSHTAGNLNFYFDCVNGRSTGYTAYDSLTTTGTAPQYTFAYSVKQYYQIKSLNQANTLLFVNGQLTSSVDQNFDKKGIKSIIANSYYVLNNLTVDLGNKGDIKSGTATVTSNGSNSNGAWKYNGTIIFFGNHKADITIDGKVYHADLITGKITL